MTVRDILILLCISQCSAAILTRSNYKPHRKIVLQSTYHQANKESTHLEPIVYQFGYKVNNPETNDYKIHEETRRGDLVTGHYSLVDPDGYMRTVEYTADNNTGFVANVRRVPIKRSTPAKTNTIKKYEPVANFEPYNYVLVHTPINYYYY